MCMVVTQHQAVFVAIDIAIGKRLFCFFQSKLEWLLLSCFQIED